MIIKEKTRIYKDLLVMFLLLTTTCAEENNAFTAKLIKKAKVEDFSLNKDICRVIVPDYLNSSLVITVSKEGLDYYLDVSRERDKEVDIKGRMKISPTHVLLIEKLILNIDIDLVDELSKEQKHASIHVLGAGTLFFIEFTHKKNYYNTFWFLNSHLNIEETDSPLVKKIFKANNNFIKILDLLLDDVCFKGVTSIIRVDKKVEVIHGDLLRKKIATW